MSNQQTSRQQTDFPDIFLLYTDRPPDERKENGNWYWDLGEKFQDRPCRIRGIRGPHSGGILSWSIFTDGSWWYHREDGPAYIEVSGEGLLTECHWFLGGMRSTLEEVLKEASCKEHKKSVLLWI